MGDNTLSSRMSYENIIRWNITGTEQIPNVAKSWEMSPDGKTYTFKLRKGMKWSDGTPYTAADIEFWFNDIVSNTDISPSFPANLKVGGEPCKFEKVDDYTVRFIFPKTYGSVHDPRRLCQLDGDGLHPGRLSEAVPRQVCGRGQAGCDGQRSQVHPLARAYRQQAKPGTPTPICR